MTDKTTDITVACARARGDLLWSWGSSRLTDRKSSEKTVLREVSRLLWALLRERAPGDKITIPADE